MIVVIQCAASKRPDAGHLSTPDGKSVMFVARPDLAPHDDSRLYAHPDDDCGTGSSWRKALKSYHTNPGTNPLRLLPAWYLYCPPTYQLLVERFGFDRLYVLSAGWGLIRSDFLTPNYDVTFSAASNVPKFKRRTRHTTFHDFRMLPSTVSDPIVFFGGKSYVPLFCQLTSAVRSQRTVFYAGSRPSAPGCTLRSFGHPFTNWHYQCAQAFAREPH